MGPLLFLIFINDLPNATDFLTLLFADDTTFQISGVDIDQLYLNANSELEKASVWFKANKLTLNVKKTKYMLFSDHNSSNCNNNLYIGGQVVNLEINCHIVGKSLCINTDMGNNHHPFQVYLLKQ